MNLDQESNAFNEQINKYGCYYFSLLELCARIMNKKNDAYGINQKYNEFTGLGWMGKDCYIVDPNKIIKSITKQEAIVTHDKPKPENVRESEYFIGKWTWEAPMTTYHHFVLMQKVDGELKVIYDPIYRDGAGSNTVKYGYLSSSRRVEWL